MNKRNIKKNRAVRENIIRKAGLIFTRWGLKKTTMNDIAKSINMAKSSLYHYYQNKERIFQEVIENEMVSMKKVMFSAIKKTDTPQKQLRTYIVTRLHLLHKMANLYDTFKNEYYESYGFIQTIRKKYDQLEKEFIKKILRNGIKTGLFIIKNLELMAYTIQVGLKAFEYPWALEKNTRKIETNIDTLLEVILYGLIKR